MRDFKVAKFLVLYCLFLSNTAIGTLMMFLTVGPVVPLPPPLSCCIQTLRVGRLIHGISIPVNPFWE